MATNDYTRRSKKDVFWGDDNNNKNSSKSDELDELFRQSEALERQKQPTPPPHEPAYEPELEPTFEPDTKTDDHIPVFDYDSIVETEAETPEEESAQYAKEFEAMEQMDETEETDEMDETDIMDENPPAYTPTQNTTPPPYIPSQTQSTTPPPTKNKEDALDGFDVEKFIKDNDTNFSITIICKVISQIIFVCLVLKCLSMFPWWIVLIGGVIVHKIINYIFSSRYKNYINTAIKSIKKVKNFNSSPTLSTPWGNLLEFFIHGDIETESEDELIIHTDETKVISNETFIADKVGKSTKELLTCEFYTADMEGRTAFANNMIIAKSSMLNVKKLKCRQKISQYTLFYNAQKDLDKCNLPRILAIADKVSAFVGDKNFAIFFGPKIINMALQIPNMDKFDYDTFNYTIADRIRRDVTAIADRVCLADILAEN